MNNIEKEVESNFKKMGRLNELIEVSPKIKEQIFKVQDFFDKKKEERKITKDTIARNIGCSKRHIYDNDALVHYVNYLTNEYINSEKNKIEELKKENRDLKKRIESFEQRDGEYLFYKLKCEKYEEEIKNGKNIKKKYFN